jgi:hypothetical protein
MSPLGSRWIRDRGGLLREQRSQRVGIRMRDDLVLYYDIDADGSVYWLLPRPRGKLERRRVHDATFADFVRRKAKQAGSSPTVTSTSEEPDAQK